MIRARTYSGYAAAAGTLLWSLPSWAEGAEGQGLPQLDATKYPAQWFWLAVTFALLYLLVSAAILPRVRSTKDKRESAIAAELDAARKANEAAKSMVTQYEKALADARANAHATVEGIVTQAAQEAAAKQAAQQKELTKRLREAEAKIMAARVAALKDVKTAAAELAEGVVEKITGMKVKA